jgi:ubiquinone biosynthesis protein COQ4
MFHPGRIGTGLVGLIRNPNDTHHVFTIVESMIGPIEFWLIGRFIESAEGRALFAKQPPVVEALTDRERLRQMPVGSLGRAYLDFVEAEGISADGLVEASLDGRVLGDDTSPELTFFRNYIRDTHDLWHTLTGYRGDIVGELSLLAFNFAQLGNLGVALIVTGGLAASALGRSPGAKGLLDPRVFENRGVVFGGWLRGLRAHWLPVADWVALLEQPLVDVRRMFQVGAPPQYEEVRA